MDLFAGMPFPVQFFLAFGVIVVLIGGAAWAVRTRFGRAKKPNGVIIARLEGDRCTPLFSAPQLFLWIGFLAMLAALFIEDSAIRLAAYGAIWTGWNVLCGIGVLSERRTDYIVYREVTAERIEPTF